MHLRDLRAWTGQDLGSLPRTIHQSRNTLWPLSSYQKPPLHQRMFVDKVCKTIDAGEASMTSLLNLKYIFRTFLVPTPNHSRLSCASELGRPANTCENISRLSLRCSRCAHDHCTAKLILTWLAQSNWFFMPYTFQKVAIDFDEYGLFK